MQIQTLSDTEAQQIYNEMKRIVHGTNSLQNQRIKIYDTSGNEYTTIWIKEMFEKIQKREDDFYFLL